MKITIADLDTPIGPMRIAATPTGLCSVDFTERCNESDAFPFSSLALLKAVGIKKPNDLAKMADAWRPLRAYAAMHLWMKDYPL